MDATIAGISPASARGLAPPGTRGANPRLSLLPRFEFRFAGAPVAVSARSQRLIVLLAVERTQLQRTFVAGTLWPDAGANRAFASLRSALWMIPTQLAAFVLADGPNIQLAPQLPVDYYAAQATARRLIDSESEVDAAVDDDLLCADLLAEWSEDWIIIEQERFRQLRLHALESLCERLTARREFAQAIQAGLAAVSGEPLRESAHRVLIRAHAAEGNQSEAIREYRRYERLLRDELDLGPSRAMRELWATLIRY
jgi:DNA-binding SARP family transcriptional activator